MACACGHARLRFDLVFAEVDTCSLSEIIAEIVIMKFDQFFSDFISSKRH